MADFNDPIGCRLHDRLLDLEFNVTRLVLLAFVGAQVSGYNLYGEWMTAIRITRRQKDNALPPLAYDLHRLALALEGFTCEFILDLLALCSQGIRDVARFGTKSGPVVLLAFFIHKSHHLLTIDHALKRLQLDAVRLNSSTLRLVTTRVRHLVWMGLEPRDSLTLADDVGGDVNLCVTGAVSTKHIVTTITVRNCKLFGVYPAHS